jgi:hypothetical protein
MDDFRNNSVRAYVNACDADDKGIIVSVNRAQKRCVNGL